MSNSLLTTLQTTYPEFNFRAGRKFLFRPPITIYYSLSDKNFEQHLLHELSHATLGHFTFKTDIGRVRMESEAWEQTRLLSIKFNIPFDENLAEADLDTYRDWLYQKSKCKKCGLTRYQTSDGHYHCPFCRT